MHWNFSFPFSKLHALKLFVSLYQASCTETVRFPSSSFIKWNCSFRFIKLHALKLLVSLHQASRNETLIFIKLHVKKLFVSLHKTSGTEPVRFASSSFMHWTCSFPFNKHHGIKVFISRGCNRVCLFLEPLMYRIRWMFGFNFSNTILSLKLDTILN